MSIYTIPNEPNSSGLADADSFVVHDSSSSATQEATMTQLRAYLDELVNVTSATVTLTAASHGSKTITLNRAAGVAVTLPDATGIGTRFRIICGTTVTSNTSTVAVPDANNVMTGIAFVAQDGGDTIVAFETTATSDTVTWNGTTTGGIKGDCVELIDIAADTWWVRSTQSATGTEATPFSAAVS